MQTLFARSPNLLSPTKRPLRTNRPLPKNIPLLSTEPNFIASPQKRPCGSSQSPKKLTLKKSEDFELCSSGAVLVLAKKVKTSEKTTRQSLFKRRGETYQGLKGTQQEVFSQRSQQKYRIRSRGYSYERTRATITLTPSLEIEMPRMIASEEIYRREPVVSLEPWRQNLEKGELCDLFE